MKNFLKKDCVITAYLNDSGLEGVCHLYYILKLIDETYYLGIPIISAKGKKRNKSREKSTGQIFVSKGQGGLRFASYICTKKITKIEKQDIDYYRGELSNKLIKKVERATDSTENTDDICVIVEKDNMINIIFNRTEINSINIKLEINKFN